MSLHMPEPPVEQLLETTRETYDSLDTAHQLDGTIRESDRTSSLTYIWDDSDHTRYIQTNVRDNGDTYEVEVEWHRRQDNPDGNGYIWDNYVVDTVPPHPTKVQNTIRQAYDEVRTNGADNNRS